VSADFDKVILNAEPTFPGCVIECRILGAGIMPKDGVENDRIVAAPPRIDGVTQPSDRFEDVDDVPKDNIDGLCRFLVEYPEEQGHDIEFKGVKPKKRAVELVLDAEKRRREDHTGKSNSPAKR
jgi:inorganic pyrophosphatase